MTSWLWHQRHRQQRGKQTDVEFNETLKFCTLRDTHQSKTATNRMEENNLTRELPKLNTGHLMPNGQRTWTDFSPTKMCVCGMLNHSVVSDSATSWTVDHQAPLSMEFSRQEYWSGLAFPTSGDLPDPGTEPMSPPLVDRFFYHWATRETTKKIHKSPVSTWKDAQDH